MTHTHYEESASNAPTDQGADADRHAKVEEVLAGRFDPNVWSDVQDRASQLTQLGLDKTEVIVALEGAGVGHLMASNFADADRLQVDDDSVNFGFNWGAFVLTPLWCLFNGKAGIGLLLIAWNFVSRSAAAFGIEACSIALMIDLGIGLYFGINGNRIVWEKKGYTSIAVLTERQRGWNIAGVVVGVLIVILFAFAISAIMG